MGRPTLDVRHSFRSLRRAPTFSLIVIVTLALVVGATAAVGSLLAARLVRAQLYGIAPSDPRTLLIGAALLLATVFAATLLPALRASSVAPGPDS